MYDATPRLLSRPVGIEWAGWRTDTLRLQQSGWEIAAHFDHMRFSYTLVLRHRMMRLYAITNTLHFEMEQMLEGGRYGDLGEVPVFSVKAVAPCIQFHTIPLTQSMHFTEIDATPRLSMERVDSLESLNIFAQRMPGDRGEVLVDAADMTVVEHLEAIKRLQAPKQAELRNRILDARREGMEIDRRPLPQSNIVAQLVNYREAA
jgi:hypothetical protein